MTARTPHGLALDNYLLNNGPTPQRHLVRYVAKFVPVGQAVDRAVRSRIKDRSRLGYATDIVPDQVAPGHESRQQDLTAIGSNRIAKDLVRARLKDGVAFINDDGLIQHRDWEP